MSQASLAPYVPRLVMQWMLESPDLRHRSIDGTLVFADISGFTELTERLAARGAVGAEEMGDILNAVFEPLLASAYELGAGLLTWGGDAVLLLFDGFDHARRASAASMDMQRVIEAVGRIRTEAGRVVLRMSIGIHTGPVDAMLVGSDYRQLVVTGPTATGVALMEKTADATEVVVSSATREALSRAGTEAPAGAKGDGWLLTRRPDVATGAAPPPVPHEGIDLQQVLARPIREHLLGGAVEPEHRHVTVGFIEFSGVDALLETEGSAATTDAVDAVISAAQRAASAYEATILGVDVNADGGKIIIASGAPTRVGEDETRVLSAVRSVLDAGLRLSLRAGVNAGRVFAGDYGPAHRRTYSIAGDCVNLAARFMAKAEDGQLVASPTVIQRSRTHFRTTSLPAFQVKGKAEPVEAVSVGAFDSTPEAASDSLPLIGRDAELQTLLACWHRAEGGSGQVVEIVAEPGLGKSRLIQELADRSGAGVLWAAGDVYGKGTPYQPMQRLLRKRLGLDEASPTGDVAERLTRTLAGIDPRILAWLPLIGVVAGVEIPDTPEVALLEDSFRKTRLELATSAVLGALLASPTVIVFEDVHFMDDATRDLASRLAADATGRPWLIILTRRTGNPTPLREDIPVTRIALSPLSDEATRSLLGLATGDRPLLPHAQAALVARAGGNPLFLRELSRSDLDLDSLPDTVDGVIAARIDRLTPQQRKLLRTAAVLGATVDERVLFAMISGPDPADLDGFLVPDRPGLWRFAHHLVREVAYAGLPYRKRAALHAIAGETIEQAAGARTDSADILSLHFSAAGRHAKTWEYSTLAGQQALAAYSHADAIVFFERALKAASKAHAEPADVAKTAEALLDCSMRLGEFDRASKVLRLARRAARGDDWHLAALALKAAWICEWEGALDRATRWASQGRVEAARVEGERASAMRARSCARTARIYYVRGRMPVARKWAERALQESSTDLHAVAEAHQVLSWVETALGTDSGVDHARRAYEAYVKVGDLVGQGRTLNDQGIRAYFQGRWADALIHYTASRDAFEQVGSMWNAAVSSANVAEILLDQGHYGQALTILNEAMDIWRAAKAEPDIAFGLYLLARIAVAQSEFSYALSLYEDSRRYFSQAGELREVVLVDALVADALLASGEAADALRAADEVLARIEQGDVATSLVHRVRGLALVRLGQEQEGEAAIRTALAAARGRSAEHEVAFALRALSSSGLATDDEKREQKEIAGRLGLQS